MTLVERIEAASATDHPELDAIDLAIAEWCHAGGAPGLVNYDPEMWLIRNDGWVRSIDAAVALAERVLPGWWWTAGRCGLTCHASVGPDRAFISEPDLSRFDAGFHADIPNPSTPALALVAAVLRAKGEG